ncbi:MAG: VOC family protein [Alphaproteobacteria bacterium]|nr:VOC family protein [Alphaproteobacteria bacterium]
MNVNPYLNFDGQTEEAMRFYADALGAELGPINRFSDIPGDMPMSDETKQRVMHVTLTLPSGAQIMASDTMPGMGPARVAGNAFTISLHPTDRATADAIFAALAEGGQVFHPLAEQFWGAYFGSLADRFGVQWMINCEAGA